MQHLIPDCNERNSDTMFGQLPSSFRWLRARRMSVQRDKANHLSDRFSTNLATGPY